MKKILVIIGIVIVIVSLIFISFIFQKKNPDINLMEYGDYKDINIDNVKQVEIIKYTEGGDNHQILNNKDDIIRIYNNLKQKKLGKKTNMACEDNTTVYLFTLIDDTKLSIEIECDWVIINKERYLLK